MKELRICIICPQTFKVITTSNRRTCSTRCSNEWYHSDPKRKQRRLLQKKITKEKNYYRDYQTQYRREHCTMQILKSENIRKLLVTLRKSELSYIDEIAKKYIILSASNSKMALEILDWWNNNSK